MDSTPSAEVDGSLLASMDSSPVPLTIIHTDGTSTETTTKYVHPAGVTPGPVTVECGLHCEGAS